MTTEHFTLQGARAATISESTSRATIFIGSVSAGMVALGLIATATGIGTAFYAFGLILLSTLSFVGFVTSDRVLQSGIEDFRYAQRIARLRAYYFDVAPELTDYLASVPPSQRFALQGLHGGYWQVFRTIAGMIGHRGPGRLGCGPVRRARIRPLGSRRIHHGRSGGYRRAGSTDAVSIPSLGTGRPRVALR
ncbi:hypothetical protein [Streptomyces sp. NPDC058613]|uniref:hypothetical protein n=1 Tax=Streptomyces sp. NPDC058613 TaxID=3346556 RepID=UPI0036619A3A